MPGSVVEETEAEMELLDLKGDGEHDDDKDDETLVTLTDQMGTLFADYSALVATLVADLKRSHRRSHRRSDCKEVLIKLADQKEQVLISLQSCNRCSKALPDISSFLDRHIFYISSLRKKEALKELQSSLPKIVRKEEERLQIEYKRIVKLEHLLSSVLD